MATELKKIILRRGTGTPPTDLAEGELAFQTDTDKLFVGTGLASPNHFKQVANLTDMGVTATATELNILDGVTATTAELNKLHEMTATTAELNFVGGVTSNIQTQIEGLSNDISALGDSLEWVLVNKITENSATLSIDSVNLGEAFDSAVYDYKFVVQLETNTEDTSIDSHITLNSSTTAGIYSFLHQHIGITGSTTNSTVVTSEYGATSQNIPILKTASAVSADAGLGGVHFGDIDFTIARPTLSNAYSTGPGLLVRGNSSSAFMTAGPVGNPASLLSATSIMNFSGSVFQFTTITSIQIVSGFNAGANDKITVKVYKRAK